MDRKYLHSRYAFSILVAWSSITHENLLKYVSGIQKRMIDVVKERDDKINK